jgi:hypothetical protein
MHDRVLMIAWRIWFARNEVMHDKELPTIEGSRRFICSYMRSLESIRYASPEEVLKGKQVIGQERMVALKPVPSESHKVWRRLAEGEVKLNTDGAFMVYTAHAGIGVIAR